ncbi:MAG: thiamine pyrophosphate-dependent enzyme [Coriobacteriia bacterium]|nr:thiamine pyrophosphate-dependent enzyme [Coriobacteriia bacterium]
MSRELCMGNQALALGALKAGINVAAGYPGTPSSEILETLDVQVKARGLTALHVEWSTNEKAALELGFGASLAGARALVTMKQVGLNVASDALMTLPYLGVKGGLVLVVADDPGPISSQTEQDTRQFAGFAKVPVLDPSTPEEAHRMIQSAFDLSEWHATPVIVRPSTRICHGAVGLDTSYDYVPHAVSGFERDPRWVIFPRRTYEGHLELLSRLSAIAADFSASPYNALINTHATAPAHQGIVAGGISYAYLHDALLQLDDLASLRLFKCGTPFPFPQTLALQFLEGLREILVFEELEPVLEREFLQLIGRHQLKVKVFGKLSGHANLAGENSVSLIARQVEALYGDNGFAPPLDVTPQTSTGSGSNPAAVAPDLPARAPVLCAGCPHRASFYAVKQALKGRPAVFSGDIGCYTLGNALPLDMVDSCVCMGAGFTVPQGMQWAQPDVLHLGFVGDSTFFASGLTGVVNAVYNQAQVTLCVLDNATTAMTGSQPHPGTGIRLGTHRAAQESTDVAGGESGTNAEGAADGEDAMGAGGATSAADTKGALDIPAVLRALGVRHVAQVDPFDLKAAQEAVREAVSHSGVSAVVFKAPCITVAPPQTRRGVDPGLCSACHKCIREIGCPALIVTSEKKARIDQALCYGCTLCAQLCPTHAIQPLQAAKGGGAA